MFHNSGGVTLRPSASLHSAPDVSPPLPPCLCSDPDNVVLCLLAADDEEEDVALQIHFTLIQAFCCENDINILRVSNMRRLAEILGGAKGGQGEPADLHCVLVTVSGVSHAMVHQDVAHFRFIGCRRCFFFLFYPF